MMSAASVLVGWYPVGLLVEHHNLLMATSISKCLTESRHIESGQLVIEQWEGAQNSALHHFPTEAIVTPQLVCDQHIAAWIQEQLTSNREGVGQRIGDHRLDTVCSPSDGVTARCRAAQAARKAGKPVDGAYG